MMKSCYLIIFFFLVMSTLNAQDVNVLLKEADNFEKQQKDQPALDKYKEVLLLSPANMRALVHSAELNLSLGSKLTTDKNGMRLYYESAASFAQRAWQTDSNNADASYIMALVADRMPEIETEAKKTAVYFKDEKRYADKALSLNPRYGKAHYLVGKWHYELLTLPPLKKAAIKFLHGGLPNADMDSAIAHMEQCKTLEPYFVANYLVLAKAYKENRRPAQAIEVLKLLVRLPVRTASDPALKVEGAQLLQSMQ